MTTKEKILTSLVSLLAEPKSVIINTEKANAIAHELLKKPVPSWNNDMQLLATPEKTAHYYFFLDSINFCFWAHKGKEKWGYKADGVRLTGYYAFSRAIKDAFLRDERFFDAHYLSTISEADFTSIFGAEKDALHLLDERLHIIRENFTILKERFDGQAFTIIEKANRDADIIVDILLEHFPSFNDSAMWSGMRAYFLKRAQIFVSDISFTGLVALQIKNLDHLTVFADYKLPQILESLGILSYAPLLDEAIQNEELIPAESREELELRASTIFAIEYLRNEMAHLGREITAQELDWILWIMAKETTFSKPHHKTLTVFY